MHTRAFPRCFLIAWFSRCPSKEQNCLSAQSKNVYLKRKFKKIIITNTYLLFEKESKKLMKIFDSNNSSSSEIMWETGVEFGNSHVVWIAGDLRINNRRAGGRGILLLQ